MKIAAAGNFWVGRLEDAALTDEGRAKLEAMTNDEFADELADMLEEAQQIAVPVVLFGICQAEAAS